MRPFFLYPLGWRDPGTLEEALRVARNMIRDGTLLLPYIPGDPLSAMIPPDAMRIGMTMYTRGLPHERMQRDRLVFIDPMDL